MEILLKSVLIRASPFLQKLPYKMKKKKKEQETYASIKWFHIYCTKCYVAIFCRKLSIIHASIVPQQFYSIKLFLFFFYFFDDNDVESGKSFSFSFIVCNFFCCGFSFVFCPAVRVGLAWHWHFITHILYQTVSTFYFCGRFNNGILNFQHLGQKHAHRYTQFLLQITNYDEFLTNIPIQYPMPFKTSPTNHLKNKEGVVVFYNIKKRKSTVTSFQRLRWCPLLL